MSRISVERKEAILKKLLPPYSMSVKEVSEEEGISTATLYYWRQQLRSSGATVPKSNTSSEQWSAQTKLAIVAETYSMTENELLKLVDLKRLLVLILSRKHRKKARASILSGRLLLVRKRL
ncbi:transposase [Vibrio splendidus]|uniref:transposase n=1 Tax=Vibrio TaxID=662 RepID=UPI00130015FF|nr:transposase [Vibrio splendidus]